MTGAKRLRSKWFSGSPKLGNDNAVPWAQSLGCRTVSAARACAISTIVPVCSVGCGTPRSRRGFQRAKTQCVPIIEEELESLEAETNRSIDLKEFIPFACFIGSRSLKTSNEED